MNAATYHPGGSWSIDPAIDIPPGPGEVRIEVSYCGICGTDVHIHHGVMDARIGEPRIVGHEMAGHIAELGAGVSGFSIGDAVTVRPLLHGDDGSSWSRPSAHIRPGLKFMGIDTPGAFQASWTVPADLLHRLPQGIDMREGALAEPLAVACHDIRLGEVTAGETVVVLGGGPIGILCALVARAKGAKVFVSELNPERLHLIAECDLDGINPLTEDLEKTISVATGGNMADCVFEVTGHPAGVKTMTAIAGIGGRIVQVGICTQPVAIDLFQFFWKELKLIGARTYTSEDFEEAISLIASRKLPLEKLISAIVPLSNITQAFELLAGGGGVMKVLVDCQAES